MDNPYVEDLIYRIEPDSTVNYDDATPVEYERTEFRVKVNDGSVRFELKEHYATEERARAAVRQFIEQWEFVSSLKHGPGQFRLRIEKPVPQVIAEGSLPAALPVARQYPEPPSDVAMDIHNRHVLVMHDQYMAYRRGRDLPVVAYICCEEFEKLGDNRKDTAGRHGISHNLIEEVRKIANTKGGQQARHANALDQPLTQKEVQFLEKAVVAMIIRAAKVAADPNHPMEKITVGNLMEISP